jgi:hypothetical protein
VNGIQSYALSFLVNFVINMLLIRLIVTNYSIVILYYRTRFNLFQKNTTYEDLVDFLYFYDMFQLIQLVIIRYYYYYNYCYYLLTPWCRVLLEQLTDLQLVKKFPAFHGTRRFITALTSFRHLSLSWASPIQSIYPHPTSWRSILILSNHYA